MIKKLLKTLTLTVAMFYAAFSFAAVDINKATAAELDSVKGIGPAISARIVDERKKGNFKDWNDFISRVTGIGEKSAANLSANGLTVGGATFKVVAADAKPAAAKSEAKAEAKKDAKPDAKAEKKSEVKADVKPEAKADKKADAKSDVKSDAKADKKAEAKPEAKSDAKKDAKKDVKAEAKTDAKDGKK
jgi:competence protein ComEA